MPARPTYEAEDLQPRTTDAFNHRSAYDARRRARQGWGNPLPPLPDKFDAPALVVPTAVAAVKKAFLQAKTSRENWRCG